jgi:hypothetical protein
MNRQRAFMMLMANQGGVSVYSIAGVVYDADGSTPVAGATVELGALSAVSAATLQHTLTPRQISRVKALGCILRSSRWMSPARGCTNGKRPATWQRSRGALSTSPHRRLLLAHDESESRADMWRTNQR